MYKNEFDFIENIKNQFLFYKDPGCIGIGDDCAVLPFNEEQFYLVSTDVLVENVHFVLNNNFSFEFLGWKSVAVNLSDVVAMGGVPKYIWIGIAFPRSYSKALLVDFYKGVEQVVEKYHISLLGGDTAASLSGLFISVMVVGIVDKKHLLLRSQAKQGDSIYVTGTLGDSALACALILNNKKVPAALLKKHMRPEPRVEAMNYLRLRYTLHSGIDLSDGLSGDLAHIAKSSKVNAKILWNRLPLSSFFFENFRKRKGKRFGRGKGELHTAWWRRL